MFGESIQTFFCLSNNFSQISGKTPEDLINSSQLKTPKHVFYSSTLEKDQSAAYQSPNIFRCAELKLNNYSCWLGLIAICSKGHTVNQH